MAVMSSRGLPSTRSRSASRPFWMEPMRRSRTQQAGGVVGSSLEGCLRGDASTNPELEFTVERRPMKHQEVAGVAARHERNTCLIRSLQILLCLVQPGTEGFETFRGALTLDRNAAPFACFPRASLEPLAGRETGLAAHQGGYPALKTLRQRITLDRSSPAPSPFEPAVHQEFGLASSHAQYHWLPAESASAIS